MQSIKKLIATFSVAILMTATVAQAAEEAGEVREIGDRVYSFTNGGGIYSMFVVGEQSVAVFETFNSEHAQKLLEAVRSVTDKPVAYAFQRHNHWDHASGGQVMSEAGAQTVMHDLAAE
jgi:glyoxylase-like metal-dependent hydrolase (beta-lactamase superfamily II)